MNRPKRGQTAAALIALLMLSYASVTSIVMQAAMARPAVTPAQSAPDSGPAATSGMDMAGMAAMRVEAAAASRAPAKSGHAKSKACPYCAVAGHLPVLGEVTPFQAPATFSFAAFRVAAGRGPRGPPSFQPRARGPPADP